jgi:endonuclease-3
MALAPAAIIERLATLYGMPVHVPHGDAVAELVLTVLSQNTADTNSGRAFTQLLRRYPSWEAVADAPVEEIIATIQVGGLAAQKAPRIQAILRAVRERSPQWDLAFLAALPLEEARAWLRSLPGVGPKTAACVLLFALGRPAMPVDTHVERVAKRLGLIPATLNPEQAHAALEALVPSADYYRFHMLLIKHGRRTCAARRPACDRCPLAPECPASALAAARIDPASGSGKQAPAPTRRKRPQRSRGSG